MHYDICLQKLGTLLIIKSEVRLLIMDIIQQIKHLYHTKNEHRLLSNKMMENQSRYNVIIKQNHYRNEASLLRTNLDNDKV
jgi:hypothetical protein